MSFAHIMSSDRSVHADNQSCRFSARSNNRRGTATVEAAFCLPLLVVLMLGMWEVGRMVQVSQILNSAAREGARYAAAGNVNGTPITVAMVQQTVKDYLTASGLPAAAVSMSGTSLTNQSSHTWTNPCDAQPMDRFTVSVMINLDNLQWCVLKLTKVSYLESNVTWVSLVDSQVNVNTQLPY